MIKSILGRSLLVLPLLGCTAAGLPALATPFTGSAQTFTESSAEFTFQAGEILTVDVGGQGGLGREVGGGGGGGYTGGSGGSGSYGGGGFSYFDVSALDVYQLAVAEQGNGLITIAQVPATAPEPGSYLLFGFGLLGFGTLPHTRRRARDERLSR